MNVVKPARISVRQLVPRALNSKYSSRRRTRGMSLLPEQLGIGAAPVVGVQGRRVQSLTANEAGAGDARNGRRQRARSGYHRNMLEARARQRVTKEREAGGNEFERLVGQGFEPCRKLR